jgi:hypothetical protein
VLNVLKFGNLNLLEPSGPVQACNGIALPIFYLPKQTQVVTKALCLIILTCCSIINFNVEDLAVKDVTSLSYLRRSEGSWRLNLQPYRCEEFCIPQNVNLNRETSIWLPSASFSLLHPDWHCLFRDLIIACKSNDAIEKVQHRPSLFLSIFVPN